VRHPAGSLRSTASALLRRQLSSKLLRVARAAARVWAPHCQTRPGRQLPRPSSVAVKRTPPCTNRSTRCRTPLCSARWSGRVRRRAS
jgi:hypothetical protein